MGFSRRERLARFGTGRGPSGWPGVGERGTTLPAPHCSRGGGTAPRASSAALTPLLSGGSRRADSGTHGGWRAGGRAWRAVRALLSRVPPRGLRAGGWGVESGSQRGFYGALLLRQEGPWAITLGDSHPPLPAPKWRGAGEGAGAAATRVRASGATHSPAIPPRAWHPAREAERSGPRALDSAEAESLPSTCAQTRLSSTARSRDRSSLNHLCYLLSGQPTRLAPG